VALLARHARTAYLNDQDKTNIDLQGTGRMSVSKIQALARECFKQQILRSPNKFFQVLSDLVKKQI
jgi:hypothetical protein